MTELSVTELMAALGVSRRQTVSEYVAAGCPHRRQGRGSRAPLLFDLAEVKAWMRETMRTGEVGRPPVGLETRPARSGPSRVPPEQKSAEELDLDERGDLAEAMRRVNLEIKRLEVRKRERVEREADGELVPLDEVRRAWGRQVEVVNSALRALPSQLAQRLVGKSYDEMREVIEDAFRNLREGFARADLGYG